MFSLGHYDPERHGGSGGNDDNKNVDQGGGGGYGTDSSADYQTANTSMVLATKGVEPGMRQNC